MNRCTADPAGTSADNCAAYNKARPLSARLPLGSDANHPMDNSVLRASASAVDWRCNCCRDYRQRLDLNDQNSEIHLQLEHNSAFAATPGHPA